MKSSPTRSAALPQRRRRRITQALLAGLGGLIGSRPVLAQPAAEGATTAPAAYASKASIAAIAQPASGEVRLALLLGNRDYPEPFDLPPIPKNLRDLKAGLERRGFAVTDALDQDLPSSRKALEGFLQMVAKAPQDATLFFYFSGHGVQVDATNLLLPARLNPSGSADSLRSGSFRLLDDVVKRVPERRGGLLIAVVDACRTSLKAGAEAGLNQVEAPPGCLIAFSTGAGRPAVAPAAEDQNTFYTASLVKLLQNMSDETLFPDMFQLVKADVRNTMLRHPVEAIRRLAQDPFIADNTVTPRALAPHLGKTSTVPQPDAADEDEDWLKLSQATWPADVVQQADAFLKAHPNSKRASGALVARNGAAEAVRILQRSDVRLFKSAFQIPPSGDEDFRRDVLRAGRGDKDAAARLARLQKAQAAAPNWINRYEGWLQMAAALGNGIASYELALHYRNQDRPLLASQWESRARELGYTPPPTLDNVRK